VKCPNCGLVNPDSAVWCDCGHAFRAPPPGAGNAMRPGPSAIEQQLAFERHAQLSRAKRDMVIGALFAIGGIVITAVTYQSAADSASGGTYIVAYGPIIFGVITFFKGLINSSR